ncbi:hypothetical protein DNFV4_01806 [Nitrospira tepida]|uniref:HTH cro/C1-type domain-containing protein n=1 Tax=Nitrospira tepida TaxID=2973512 RepID=A0AA86MYH2_9BACT|nr:helix-turn-helix transcriptional regulator [Nitrospira tepida]CAI4031380.1 hypothetical protein DNFV4_01806 [Nitrospira tepida]
MHPKVIGENVRRHRDKCHWTQEELAIAADIDARTVQRAESGQMVAFDTLKAFASAFDTTVDELAKDHKHPDPITITWRCPELGAIWSKHMSDVRLLENAHLPWYPDHCREHSKLHSDWLSSHNTHVRTCPTCRDNKESLHIEWRGFDDCKETIEEWVVDSRVISLKDALHNEETISLEGVLTEQQILAINARFLEAEHQWASADLEAIAGLWEVLDRDLINILERNSQTHGASKPAAPYQEAGPC